MHQRDPGDAQPRNRQSRSGRSAAGAENAASARSAAARTPPSGTPRAVSGTSRSSSGYRESTPFRAEQVADSAVRRGAGDLARAAFCGLLLSPLISDGPGERARRRCGAGGAVPADQRTQARQATGATILRYGTGPWREAEAETIERARGGYGMLVVDGLLLRRRRRRWAPRGRVARPGRPAAALAARRRVHARRRVDVARGRADADRGARHALDVPRLALAAARRRARGPRDVRALRLVTSMAIAQQPKLDIRLWMLFGSSPTATARSTRTASTSSCRSPTRCSATWRAPAGRRSLGALTRLAQDSRCAPAARLSGAPVPSAPLVDTAIGCRRGWGRGVTGLSGGPYRSPVSRR